MLFANFSSALRFNGAKPSITSERVHPYSFRNDIGFVSFRKVTIDVSSMLQTRLKHFMHSPSHSGTESVHMVASSDGKTRKGDTVMYITDVDNVGNTCLTNVEVRSSLLGDELKCDTSKSKGGCCSSIHHMVCMPHHVHYTNLVHYTASRFIDVGMESWSSWFTGLATAI